MGKVVAVAATMAAIAFPGGNGAEAALAEQSPVSSPEIFNECAGLATAKGVDQTVGIDVPIGVVRAAKEEVALSMRDGWEGPLQTVGGVACEGMVRLSVKLQLRSGNIRQTTDRAGVGFGAQSEDGINMGGSWKLSYGRICNIARNIQDKKNPKIGLVQTSTRSYSEPGYPTVKTIEGVKLANLPCERQGKNTDSAKGDAPSNEHPPIDRYPGR